MIVLETLGRRWFAFAFIAALVWAAWPEGGGRRAARFIAIASVASFAAEYVSTHTGFPYGRYDYIAATRGDELYLSNVPLFVPLSFGSVVFAGRALALGTRFARTRTGLALTGAAFATAIDYVIDPVTLRGSMWFLGSLYRYRADGVWFDIPWTNFAGWFLVGAVILLLDGVERPDSRARGRMMALGICGSFIVLAVVIAAWPIAIAGIAVTAAIAAVVTRLDARVGSERA